MSNGLISVIIPAFKMGQFIGEALESIGEQTYPHWEVIVVDDAGPEDGTRATVEAFAAKYTGHRVEYIQHDTNQGVSVARRTAFEAARGEFIAFLDADDVFIPEKLAKQIKVLENDADVILVHGPVMEMGQWPPHMDGPKEWFAAKSNSERYQVTPLDLVRHNHICNSTVVVRKCSMRREDFAPQMCFQFEDLFLWALLAKRGPFYYEKERLTGYRFHHGSFTAAVLARPGRLEFARLELTLALFPYLENWSDRVKLCAIMLENMTRLLGSRSARGTDVAGRYGLKLQLSLVCAAIWSVLCKIARRPFTTLS